MQIRSATLEDSRKIAEVHQATWKSTYRGIIAQGYLDALSLEKRKDRWDEILRNKKEKEISIVAEVGERIVGFLSGGPNRTSSSEFEAEIYSLYLHPEFQKRGIGAALLNQGKSGLQRMGFKSVVVWVLKENPSRHFYERMGGLKSGEKCITIGEQILDEFAYGWTSI